MLNTNQNDEEQVRLIVCVSWGKQTIKAVKTHCIRCNEALALSEGNAKEAANLKLQTICINCVPSFEKEHEDFKMGGGMVDGKLIEDPMEAVFMAFRLMRDQNSKRKNSDDSSL